MKKIAMVLFALCVSIGALAHQITDEQRKEKITFHEKMAESHRAMAECLKAGKPLDDCSAVAMKTCPMTSGDCPFMEKGHMDKKMMRDHMKKMKDQKED